MKKLYFQSFLFLIIALWSFNCIGQNEQFSMRQLACNLSQPWEIKFGPDGYLWVSEAHTYQISRIDPVTGAIELMLDLSSNKDFPDFNEADVWPQGGLQGFGFHPDFDSHPYFYVGYVYHFDQCLPDTMGCYFKTKVERYTYNINPHIFSNRKTINDSIPGSSDHNGGRLAITPDSTGGAFLFYSVGDMASGHLGNAARPHRGQQINTYEGKILRFNLEPDSDPEVDSFPYNAWIPDSNPFNTPNKQSAVWTLGHRNPQGLAFSPDGILYESEHGPYSDDEINIITKAHNYGFPLIVGFVDGNYDNSAAGAGSGIPFIESEAANRAMIQTQYVYDDPIASFFQASRAVVHNIYLNDVYDTPPYPNYYLQWPTIAPSGIDHYSSDAIPGWKNSLLIANLKYADVFRLKLSADGRSVVGDTSVYFQGMGRFRDIAISADGKKIYVSTDSIGMIKGAPGESVVPPNRGCILEFTYLTTANKDLSGQQIQVYPNPASQNITLRLPAEIKEAVVSLSTLSGKRKIVTKINSELTDINTSELQSGLYILEVVHNKNSWSEKIILK